MSSRSVPPMYDYQRASVLRALDSGLPYWGFFCEQGTGKSKMMIELTEAWYEDHQLDIVLLVAPNVVYNNWIVKELPQHNPAPYVAVRYKSGLKSCWKALDNALAMAKFERKQVWLCLNVEAFATPTLLNKLKAVLKDKRYGVIVDESSTIKNPKAQRTKSLLVLGEGAVARMVATGTPQPQGVLDWFSQCEFLEKGLLGFKNQYAMRNHHCVLERNFYGGRSFDKIVGYKYVDKLTDRIKSFSTILKKSDCLDLPEKVYTYVVCDPPESVVSKYREMRSEFLISLNQGQAEAVGVNGATTLVKLHQLANGYVKDTNDQTYWISDFKLQAILDYIKLVPEEESILIWAPAVPLIEGLVSELEKVYPDDVATLYGATPMSQRQGNADDFTSKRKRFMVANPSVAGMGLTFTHCRTVLYMSNSFNLEHRLQSEDRTHRIGQEHKVTYVDFVTQDTMEIEVLKRLLNKESLSLSVLGGNSQEMSSMARKLLQLESLEDKKGGNA
jgi:SNF2 family DNA or RNA helicase